MNVYGQWLDEEWIGAVKDPQACTSLKQALAGQKQLKTATMSALNNLGPQLKEALDEANEAVIQNLLTLQDDMQGKLKDTEANIIDLEAKIKDACQEISGGGGVPGGGGGGVPPPAPAPAEKKSGVGTLGIVLLVGATLGAIYLAMSGVGSKTADNPHCPNCY